jgi:hypothetical protein
MTKEDAIVLANRCMDERGLHHEGLRNAFYVPGDHPIYIGVPHPDTWLISFNFPDSLLVAGLDITTFTVEVNCNTKDAKVLPN